MTLTRRHACLFAMQCFAAAMLLAGCVGQVTRLQNMPTRTTEMNTTAANRVLVEQFVELLYQRRDVRHAFEGYVSPTKYIQHNPNLPDGREAAIVALTPKFSAPDFDIEPVRIVVEGDIAVVHLRVRPSAASRGAAVVDIFRFEGGQIVEHWDVLQAVPDNPVSRHPMF